MPTYEYRCAACGHEFELFQSIKSKPTRKCPKCGKNKVDRLLGVGSGMIFKGSGFYITDYRSEGYKQSAKAAEGAGGGSGGESAPAAAAAPATAGSTGSSSEPSAPKSDSASAKPAGDKP